MSDLSFTPTEDRILARITHQDEFGNIDGMVKAIGPDANIDIDDDVHVPSGCFDKMTISGVECILFKESELFEK